MDWQQQEEDSNSKYCVFIAVSISKLQNSTWGDLVPSSTKRPPLKRLVTGEKRLRMALKNWACPGWGRPRTRARASREVVGRFLMVITVSAPGQSLWWTGWLAGHTSHCSAVSPPVSAHCRTYGNHRRSSAAGTKHQGPPARTPASWHHLGRLLCTILISISSRIYNS